MSSWYLILTKPRQEHTARENLERQGYSTYLPVTHVRTRQRGRAFTRIAPMFPRYLFIRLSAGVDDWGPIRSTLGVTSIVRFGQLPAKVPDSLISKLRDREDEAGIQVLPVRKLSAGDRLRIAEGPLEGYEGLFYAHSSRDRVVLLIQILEQNTRVQVSLDKVEKVNE